MDHFHVTLANICYEREMSHPPILGVFVSQSPIDSGVRKNRIAKKGKTGLQ